MGLQLLRRPHRLDHRHGILSSTHFLRRGISTVTFGQHFVSDNSIPLQTDKLSMRGTAAQLGLAGERHLSVPLPAEVDQEKVVVNMKAALIPTPNTLADPLR